MQKYKNPLSWQTRKVHGFSRMDFHPPKKSTKFNPWPGKKASWWLNQPLWKKYARKIGSYPHVGVKIKPIWDRHHHHQQYCLTHGFSCLVFVHSRLLVVCRLRCLILLILPPRICPTLCSFNMFPFANLKSWHLVHGRGSSIRTKLGVETVEKRWGGEWKVIKMMKPKGFTYMKGR